MGLAGPVSVLVGVHRFLHLRVKVTYVFYFGALHNIFHVARTKAERMDFVGLRLNDRGIHSITFSEVLAIHSSILVATFPFPQTAYANCESTDVLGLVLYI